MSPTRPRSRSAPTPAPHARASEIVPGLYVGGWHDALEFPGTKVCVRDEPPGELPGVTHFPIYDPAADRAIPESLERVARLVESARARGETVLVFCGHGIRRGPLAVAWYLRRSEHRSLDEAYDQIRRLRPGVERASEWIGDLSNLADRE